MKNGNLIDVIPSAPDLIMPIKNSFKSRLEREARLQKRASEGKFKN
jgi:hypothetical protein